MKELVIDQILVVMEVGIYMDEERWFYCEGHILSARPSVGKGGGEILPEFWP